MILGLLVILVGGFLFGLLFEQIKIPKIIGMIIFGILISPSVFNLVNETQIKIAPYLRQLSLVIILTRSGLSLNFDNLKANGISGIMLALIPATFEIIGVTIFAPILLGISVLEALLLGSVLAAVSPAIVVPRMIKLKNEKYGANKNIPELIMAGASVDDIYVIIVFYLLLGIIKGGTVSKLAILTVPLSILLGIILGIALGILISYIYKKIKMNIYLKTIILLVISVSVVVVESLLKNYLDFEALLAIVVMGIVLLYKRPSDAEAIEKNYKKVWFIFEIFLFVLVGLSIDLKFAISNGMMPLLLLLIALLFRTVGVFISLVFTKLNLKEKLFIIFSYLPKATVQASIGAIALNEGLAVGPLVLTLAVLSILVTAPLGAVLIDNTYKHLLLFEKIPVITE